MNVAPLNTKNFQHQLYEKLPQLYVVKNLPLKGLVFLLLLFIHFTSTAQVNVSVNVNSTVKVLTGKESGINLNYLMDDAVLSPLPTTTTTNALKQMGVKFLRYPGGEESDNYFFSASPWLSSSPRMALLDPDCYWPTNDPKFVNTNDPNKTCKPVVLDFDEFMTMCISTGAEPLIVVAYDGIYNTSVCAKPTKAQMITHATEWVRYANITKNYKVKYWMIGNESWNSPTYNGQTTPAQYAIDFNDFAIAMRSVDPTIKLIANGAIGWWATLLQSSAAPNIDFLGYSEYPTYNFTGGYDYYRLNDVNLTWETDAAINDISNYATITDKARIKVMPTEFNSIDYTGNWSNDNNLGHALANFQMFGDLVIKPKVEAAFLWGTRWITNATAPQNIFDALDANGNLNANGLAQQLWSKMLPGNMVSTTSSNNTIKVFATYNNANKQLNIALLNKEIVSSNVNLSIISFGASFIGSRSELKGTSPSDKFPSYSQVAVINGLPDVSSLTIPPASITLLEIRDITVLPLQLTSFTGIARQQGNLLQWKTTGENKVTGFEIQSSEDGASFKYLGNVKAIQQTGMHSYTFTDNDVKNDKIIFYRLRINNNDGSFIYSPIINLKAIQTPSLEVSIFPNPADGNLGYEISSTHKQNAIIHILQMDGKIIYERAISVNAGKNFFSLPAYLIKKAGMYLLEVNNGTSKTVTRFNGIPK